MTYCSACAAQIANPDKWPRVCVCGNIQYRNPTPVAVLILPVEMEGYDWPGVLVQQRSIEPKRGQWALTGGFTEYNESAEENMWRELTEEVRLGSDGGPIRIMMTRTINGRILIFGVAQRRKLWPGFIQEFLPTNEVSAVDVVTRETYRDLCFPTHTEALKKFFAESDHWWY